MYEITKLIAVMLFKLQWQDRKHKKNICQNHGGSEKNNFIYSSDDEFSLWVGSQKVRKVFQQVS